MKRHFQYLAELAVVLILAVAIVGTAYATGSSITMTYNNASGDNAGRPTIVIEWVSDSALGYVYTSEGVNVTKVPADFDTLVAGKDILLGVTDPDATDAPTDNYDGRVFDEYGCDMFGGALNDRDQTNSEQMMPYIDPVNYVAGIRTITDTIYPAFLNTGNSKKGKLVLHLNR
ncbi:MAG: hypothetical protein ABFD81_07090 [Syntrophaceae bacterium]